MQPNTIGLICTILAPAFYAGMSIASKLAGAHMSIWQVSFGRFILGLLVIPVIVRMRGLGLWGRRRLLLTLRGVCGAAAFLLLVAAFQRISLTLAMVLFYTYPAFTAMLSPWVAGESAKRSAWIFIAGAFAGTTLILWPTETGGSTVGSGHLFAIAASMLCAVTVVLVRKLGRENNIYTLFYYLCLTGTLSSLVPLLLQSDPMLPENPAAWIELPAVALFSIGAQLTINQALVHIPAASVSVMMTAEVPLVACFGILFLGEPLGTRLLIGALLVFSSGVGLNILPAFAVRRRR